MVIMMHSQPEKEFLILLDDIIICSKDILINRLARNSKNMVYQK